MPRQLQGLAAAARPAVLFWHAVPQISNGE